METTGNKDEEKKVTEDEEEETTKDASIISDEVGIAHYIFIKNSITAQTIGKILI
jgi:hypothetical protein